MRTPDAPYEDPFRAHLRERHDWPDAKLDAVEGSFERAHTVAHDTENAGHSPGELEVSHGVRYRPPPPEVQKALGSFAQARERKRRDT